MPDQLPAQIRATQRLAVLQTIRHSPMTCDEIELAAGMRHQTASARVTELRKAGLIASVGARRKTRSGATAAVQGITAAGLAELEITTKATP